MAQGISALEGNTKAKSGDDVLIQVTEVSAFVLVVRETSQIAAK
jgi:hypothetical protein